MPVPFVVVLEQGYIVNQMGPPNLDTSNSKLDVIFFEGNVGRRKDFSCKDTWVQRNKPSVWWPRDWLPLDVEGDIRVLLLEYSISDDGVEGVLDQLQSFLVFRYGYLSLESPSVSTVHASNYHLSCKYSSNC